MFTLVDCRYVKWFQLLTVFRSNVSNGTSYITRILVIKFGALKCEMWSIDITQFYENYLWDYALKAFGEFTGFCVVCGFYGISVRKEFTGLALQRNLQDSAYYMNFLYYRKFTG